MTVRRYKIERSIFYKGYAVVDTWHNHEDKTGFLTYGDAVLWCLEHLSIGDFSAYDD